MTSTPVVAEESTVITDDASWRSLLDRLNHLSVHKHFDAYADIDWDSAEFALDPADPRCELPPEDPLSQTEWYRSLPAEARARLGCDVTASKMKTGLQFESILKRGLLEFAAGLPNGSPEFRYAYHEVIEEAQHALMFQEFVNRSGFDAAGLGWFERAGARVVLRFAHRFPPLFFMFVLGGEDPIDHVQRRSLRREDLHPLLGRIMRIHVTEEARHLSFARHYLKRTVPALTPARRAALAVGAPVVLASMAQLMLVPSAQVIATHQIPKNVIDEAYRNNPEHHRRTAESLAKVTALCKELGLLRAPYGRLWKTLGLVA
jgi:hypothetical protein